MIVVVAILLVSVMPSRAQRVTLNRSVDYNVLEASSVHEHNRQIYLLYRNGEIARAVTETGIFQNVTTPANVLPQNLFTYDNHLWFRSTEGHLWYLDTQEFWIRLEGTADCFYVSRNDDLYTTCNDSVFRFERTSGGYQRSLLRVLPTVRRSYSVFVRNDTILAHVLPDNSTSSMTVMSTPDVFRENAFGTTSSMYALQFVERSDGQIYVLDYTNIYLCSNLSTLPDAVRRIQTSLTSISHIHASKINGQVILGISGYGVLDHEKCILLDEKGTELVLEDVSLPQYKIQHVFATTLGDALLWQGNVLELRNEAKVTFVQSEYSAVTRRSAGLQGYPGIVDGKEYQMYAGTDTMMIVSNGGLLPVFTFPESQKSMFQVGDGSFVYGKDSVFTILSRDGIYSINEKEKTFREIQRNVRRPERKVLLRDSSMIAAGSRSIWLSSPHGGAWRRISVRQSFTIGDVAESVSAIMLQYDNEIVVLHRSELMTEDSITTRPYISFTNGPRMLLDIVDTVGTIISPYQGSADENSVGVLSFVRITPSTTLDSIVVQLSPPFPVRDGYAVAQRFGDTTIYFQPATGILLRVVGSRVVSTAIVPPSVLGPFPTLTRPQILWAFHSSSSLTLTHRSEGLHLTLDLESTTTSAIDEQDNLIGLFSISPTPAQDRVTIQLSKLPAAQTSTATLQLVDVNGSMVKDLTSELPRWTSGTFEVTDMQFDVRHVPNGIYFLVLSNGQTSHLAKLIVQR